MNDSNSKSTCASESSPDLADAARGCVPLGFGHIAVEGPIGVGKTTLARRLSTDLGGELLLEAAHENPFLPRFYTDPRGHALPTQLFFLLQRARQVRDLVQADMFAPLRVADFMVEKDRLFAELNLDADELSLYLQVYEQVIQTPPCPDLVIYLQAPVKVLRERVAMRGIDYEEPMQSEYLERLVEAYREFFHRYEDAPVLVVDAAEIDLAHGDRDYKALLKRLGALEKGRYYLNPLPI